MLYDEQPGGAKLRDEQAGSTMLHDEHLEATMPHDKQPEASMFHNEQLEVTSSDDNIPLILLRKRGLLYESPQSDDSDQDETYLPTKDEILDSTSSATAEDDSDGGEWTLVTRNGRRHQESAAWKMNHQHQIKYLIGRRQDFRNIRDLMLIQIHMIHPKMMS